MKKVYVIKQATLQDLAEKFNAMRPLTEAPSVFSLDMNENGPYHNKPLVTTNNKKN